MGGSNTRGRDGAKGAKSSSTRPPPSILCCGVLRFRMPSKFNIFRFCIYALVLLWTVVCLAIAVHFQNVLLSSDLTRFVPFAIFVCSASLLIIIALLGFGLWRDRNPISTRVELGCLGLLGVLWLALGAFLGSSASGDSDVECFSSADATEPTELPGFNTETFHAQYRVLEAFSVFNVILILGFLFFLLYLAVRHHKWEHRDVWTSSVTAFPWFAGRDAQTGKLAALPAPATTKRSHSTRSQRTPADGMQKAYVTDKGFDTGRGYVSELPYAPERRPSMPGPRRTGSQDRKAPAPQEKRPAVPEKRPSQSRNHQRRPSATRRDSPTRNEAPTYVYRIPHTQPEPARVGETARQVRDKYMRDASPRR
ncbi:hypothetical protein PHLGIDRAFT_18279 [Phlebiopsis gigantea 11061_1 CR5-6]|uniref:MARVEL domain-containing protein n=1 Tax=Phlebiopsis gigantea (strain 11061_1 CR5-6) TaxID=745531 RepID=A0A0C3SEL7_PHLG1|nr:hypothetical protein PHLGIDRAFT_18279 [Phlebiopsis gigantea 11061_1 CR5-6]